MSGLYSKRSIPYVAHVGNGVAETVAQSVREAIEEAGSSVHATALDTGIPYTTLDRKLRNGGKFTIEELGLLATALHKEPASFLTGPITVIKADQP